MEPEIDFAPLLLVSALPDVAGVGMELPAPERAAGADAPAPEQS